MVVKVTAPDIVDKVTTGEGAATLINDSKRAINQLVDGKEDALGSPRVNDWVLSSSTDKVRKWVDMSGEAISYKLDNALGSTAWRTSTDTGGGGGTGKLEWGTPIPYDLRFPITQPVINGNTWESTTVVGVGDLKGIAYSTLIPQGVYTDFTINMVGSAEARTLLYFNESVPSVEAFESTSISGFYISITGAGVVTFNKNGEKESLATVVGTFPFPISFGLRTATPMSEPTLLVNGTGYTVGASQHTYLSLSSLFEGIVENDSVVVELNPTTKTHEAAELSSFIGTLDTLPTKFSPLQHNLPESESSLVDNIDSSSITKVSPKKLNSWLVTKQLTPDDIANATANAGTVSGEQLAALGGGGGGPEVLKDWTTVHSGDAINFLEGLTIANLDTIQVEVRRLETTTEVVHIEVRNSSSALITPTVKNSSRRLFGGVNFEVLSNIPVFFRGRFGGGSKNRVSEGVLNFDISTSGTQISITTQAKGYGTDGNTLQLAYLHDSQQTYATTDFAYVGFTPVTNQSYSFRVLQLEA